VDDHAKARMREVLTEIQNGTFAKEWIAEYQGGLKNYKRLLEADLDQKIEKVGRELRSRMSWLQE
jgi:ketol-acid reductoisomerase